MASVQLITEDEATGKVKVVYGVIKSELGIDFVPNLYPGDGFEPGLPRGQQCRGDHARLREARSLDEGDHRGRRLGGERLRLSLSVARRPPASLTPGVWAAGISGYRR